MSGRPELRQLSFWTEAYPQQSRDAAWRDQLGAARLRCDNIRAAEALHGTIQFRVTAAGIELAIVASVPQTIALDAQAADGLLMCMLLEGTAELCIDGSSEPLSAGQLVCVPGLARSSLTISTAFRLLVVHIAPALLASRMDLAPPASAMRMQGEASTLLSQILQSVAGILEAAPGDDPLVLQPFEGIVTESLAAALTECRLQARPDRLQGRAFMARVGDLIQKKLADPGLSLSSIAADLQVSGRYLQKLFEKSGTNFSAYVRTTRLEHCRADLANRHYDKLSVSDICFRWGFNDPSHFSHAFREQFGMPPSAYRDRSAQTQAKDPARKISRGLPAGVKSAAPAAGAALAFGHGSAASSVSTSHPRTDNLKDGSILGARHHWVHATDKTVHWGYLSRNLPPVLTVESHDYVTIETLTQHAADDWERMVEGDVGAESVFHWTATRKNVDRRGAGPIDASIYGRGAGEGFGVHICTGPIAVRGAMPGDVLELRILDIQTRPCANPRYPGKAYGSNAATWWGFHFRDLVTEPREREVVTIFEIDCERADGTARALYNFRWTPQRDPFGVVHDTIDYPGVPVDHSTIEKNHEVLPGVRIPIRPHFGVIAVAPDQDGLVDSIPPSTFAGNLDNWRITRGASVFLRVAVPGALLSIGDPHASQGDSELCGTAIECSLTGDFQLILHPRDRIAPDAAFADLSYPLVETRDEWILHGFSLPNHLTELGQKAQSQIYMKSTLDDAMRDAFRKTRRFLMSVKGLSEDEAVTLISVAVDFGITQVVNGNWGVHAIIRKSLFTKA